MERHTLMQPGDTGKIPMRDLMVLVLLWGLASALNFAKPFHMDDTAHLLIAQQIVENPLHPMSGLLNWLDTAEPIFITNQPHFFYYLIAGVMAVFGSSELILHLGMSAFVGLAIILTYQMGRRFVPGSAIYISAALVLGPGFLINQNVMSDIPLLVMMTGAVLLLGTRAPSNRRAIAGFGVFSLALLTKYTALFLFPALVWAALQKRAILLAALLPILALIVWSLFNIVDYGAAHILNRPANVGGVFPSPKLFFALVSNMGIFAVPVAALLLVSGRMNWLWGGIWLLGVAAFYILTLYGLKLNAKPLMLPNAFVFGASVVLGAAAGTRIFQLIASLWRVKSAPLDWYRDNIGETTLVAWAIGGALFLSIFPPFMATRHALLIALPFFVLALRADNLNMRRWVNTTVLILWGIFGVFITLNDIEFARFYRDQAPIAAAQARELAAPGSKIYFRGHWGWQWYARQAGMIEYDTERSVLRPGDLLVDPVGISAQRVDNIDTFKTLATLTQTRSMFTLLDTHRFYASGAVVWPVFKPGQPRVIQILRKEN